MRPVLRPFVLLLLGALPGLAATPPETDPVLAQGVRAAVQVTAMDLDVVATKDGRPVEDLARDEFRVTVDGKDLPLDYFTRVAAGTLHGPDLSTASPDLVLETLQNDAGERYVARQFLVFFDDAHLVARDRPRIIEALRDLVTRLTPSDRMALVAFDTSPTVLVPFTAEKEALLSGLARLDKKAPSGQSWESQFRQQQNDLRVPCQYAAFNTRARSRCDSGLRSWSEQVRARETGALRELRRAVAALSARSGKRVFLYVSRGLELYPGQALVQSIGPAPLSQLHDSVTEEFRKVITEANRSGVTVHSLDARGLSVEGIDAGEAQPSVLDSFWAHQSRREALARLAQETGGLLVENRNVFTTAVDRIYAEASTYYSVGVTLAALDPKKALISVKVATTRPGVALRVRNSWGAKSADEAARDRMEMALVTPDATGDFPISLEVAPSQKGGGIGRRISPFVVRIPISALTFVESNGTRTATLDVSLAAVDDGGAKSDVATARVPVAVPVARWEEAVKSGFTYRGEMKGRKGNVRFVATVRDLASDRIGVASASVRIE